jgi:hypothetical protein
VSLLNGPHWQIQVHRVVREGRETIFDVKPRCLVIDSQYLDGMNAELPRQRKAAIEGVHQQSFAQTLATRCQIDGQPAQQGDRDGMLWQLFGLFRREMLEGD